MALYAVYNFIRIHFYNRSLPANALPVRPVPVFLQETPQLGAIADGR